MNRDKILISRIIVLTGQEVKLGFWHNKLLPSVGRMPMDYKSAVKQLLWKRGDGPVVPQSNSMGSQPFPRDLSLDRHQRLLLSLLTDSLEVAHNMCSW